MKKKHIWWWIASPFILTVALCGVYFLWRTCSMTEVDKYKPYAFTRGHLSNGLEVLLIQDESLPYVSLDIMFRAGSGWDPQDKEGVMSLLVEILDKGTKKRSAMQVTEDLELLGSGFLYALEKDMVFFSVETLSYLNKEALEIFAEILTRPAFLEEEFQRAREKAQGRAKRRAENFSSYAGRAFNKYLYESHPYGFYQGGSLGSLQNIQLKDIKSAYNHYFTPRRAVLSVSGRYPADIMKRLERVLGGWNPQGEKKIAVKGEGEKRLSVTVAPEVKKTELLLVDHPSAVQSEIRIGHIALNRSHPDYLPLTAGNIILGGSFNSRLMNRIRVQKGLTYGISSRFAALKELGAFKVGLAVRNDKVGSALLEVMGVLENFHKNGITKEELDKARQILKNRFIAGGASADSYAHYLMYLNSHNIPYSYAEQYFEKLADLSLEDINRAVKEHLRPDKIKILILTNADQVKSQLRDFNPLTKSYKSFL